MTEIKELNEEPRQDNIHKKLIAGSAAIISTLLILSCMYGIKLGNNEFHLVIDLSLKNDQFKFIGLQILTEHAIGSKTCTKSTYTGVIQLDTNEIEIKWNELTFQQCINNLPE